MQISGIVNPPANQSVSDGSQPIALMGKSAELLAAQLHSRYYTQAYRGVAFTGSTAGLGVVVPTYSTTSQVFGIWNPAGNTRNAALQVLDGGCSAIGTMVVANFVLAQNLNAGSATATGGITNFTAGTPSASLVGAAAANSVRFCPLTATTPVPTILMTLNYSYFSTGTAAPGSPGIGLHYDFDEGVIVPPNVAVWVANSTVANGSTFNLSLRWGEPPV